MAPRKRKEASKGGKPKVPSPKSKRAKVDPSEKPPKPADAPNPEEAVNVEDDRCSSPSLEEIPPPNGDAEETLRKLELARLREEIAKGKAMEVGFAEVLTVVLHWGGEFVYSPHAEYIGGSTFMLEDVEPSCLTLMELTEHCIIRGVMGALHYRFNYIVGNKGLKIIVSDEELVKVLTEKLENGVVHLYLEADVLDMLPSQDRVVSETESDDDYEPKKHEAYIDAVEPETESSESDQDVVDAQTECFDENCVSDEDNRTEGFPIYNPKTCWNPTFQLGMLFSSKQEFRKAIQSHAIMTKRNLKTVRNNKDRVYVKCAGPNCHWRIHLNKLENEPTWQINDYKPDHECAPTHEVKNMKAKWLGERFQHRFQTDLSRKLKSFRLDVIKDLRCNVSRQQSLRAKKRALELIQGDPNDQYRKLWSYVGELRLCNPGSTILLGTDEQNRFSNLYICFDALRRGFLGGCRPLLGVDGCWLKGSAGGVLLSAIGVDPNNNLYPVAFAVVKQEDFRTWEWFLTVLKEDLEIVNAESFTIISDKQKGLIKAVGSVFFGAEHRYCVRHMHNNMKAAGFRGTLHKNLLWGCAQATTVGEFREGMRRLKDHSEALWEWFNDKPPTQWSKAYFRETSKCDMLLNNVSESFNSCILEARDKPIITLCEWIRVYIMRRLQKCRDRASGKWKSKLCPKIQKMLDGYKATVGDFIPIKAHHKHYQVSCYDGTQYAVDMEKWQCTCRLWQLTGIPCKHATCAILTQGLNLEDYVDRYYFVDTYLKVYQHAILGVSYEKLWGDSTYIPPLPPHFAKPSKGRPVRQRRREEGEPSKGGRKGKGKVDSATRLSRIRKKGKKGKQEESAQEVPVVTDLEEPNVVLPPSDANVDIEEISKEEMTQIETAIDEYLVSQEANIIPPTMYEQLSASHSQRSNAQEEINLSQLSQGPFTSQEQPVGAPSIPPSMHPRVNIRAPAPFTESGVKAAWVNPEDIQPMKEKKVVVEDGIKYLDLSLPPRDK